jgi:hypothetical protein
MTTTVRVTAKTHQHLRELASETNESIQDIVAKAVEAYRRKWFIDQTNAAYAALRADPVAWAEIEAERAILDGALADGLEPECFQ